MAIAPIRNLKRSGKWPITLISGATIVAPDWITGDTSADWQGTYTSQAVMQEGSDTAVLTFSPDAIGKTCNITYFAGGDGRVGSGDYRIQNGGTYIVNSSGGKEYHTASFTVTAQTLTLYCHYGPNYSQNWTPSAICRIGSMTLDK